MKNKYPLGKVNDNNKYFLKPDLDGKSHSLEELQNILLEIVLEIDRICRKNNIGYALAFGSTLGIINYGGIIPWDDDIDIAIDYFDIPRFIKALDSDLSPKYYYQCYEKDKKYNVLIPTFKIRKRNTYIKDSNYLHLPNKCEGNGVFIDVVAFMGVPKDIKKHKKLLSFAKKRMPLYVFFDSYLHIPMYKMKKKIKDFENKVAYKYKDSKYVAQTVIIPFQDWGNEVDHLSYPYDVIYPFKEYDFMGHKLFSFNNIEEFCRLKFGDRGFIKEEDGRWVDKYPLKRRNPKHIKEYSLNRDK